jgi:ABC-type lipoprotein release transport system permease subunit
MRNRFRNLASYALNCIQRYKVRTLVILVCLSIVAFIFSSISFMKDGLVLEGELSLKYAPDLTVQGIFAGRQSLVNTSHIYYIQKILGVRAVEERIWGYGNVGNTLLVIVGINLGNPVVSPTSAFPLASGSFLDPQRNNSVVIGKAVADLMGAEVGSWLAILTESNQVRQYEVVGIFSAESSIYNADMILMSETDARLFFDVPEGKVTDLLIYTEEVNEAYYVTQLNFVAREISELPNVRVLTKDILLKAQETTYGARSGFFSVTWFTVLVSAAIVAFNQTIVVGHESRFEVGLLKALGFSTSDIIQVRLIESGVLGVIAGSIGIIAGIFFDVVLGAPMFRDFMLGWAVLYPSFPVPVHISIQTVLITYAITVVPLLFATVIPSWLNATVDPDLAMRGARA